MVEVVGEEVEGDVGHDLGNLAIIESGFSNTLNILVGNPATLRGDGTDRTIDTHIKRLRAKLEPERNRPTYVLTVWGFGYKFSDKFV